MLIVDDNVDSALAIERLLKTIGHEVRTTHEGKAAIDIARRFKPKFVLLDIGLPGMNSYEVASELRKLEEIERMIIIAITGYGQSEARARSKAAGFDHHLVKPVDFDLLQTLLSGSSA